MQFNQATYFRDTSDSDSSGLVIVQVDDKLKEYRVTERRDGEWCAPFWMPATELQDMFRSDDIQEVDTLSDEKFVQVENMARGVAA